MGLRKRKRHPLTKETRSHTHTLHSLITSIRSPQGLNSSNFKKLHIMLLLLSVNKSTIRCSNCESDDMELDKCRVKLKYKDFHDLSDVLFKELESRFEELFSALHSVHTTAGGRSKCTLITSILEKGEELILLLRCCMVMLGLIDCIKPFNLNLLMEKGKILLSILGKLISFELSSDGGNETNSITFKRLVSVECTYNSDCTASVAEESFASKPSLELSGSCYTLLCAVLEVFADELLAHKSLREYFLLIDSASSKSEMLFNFHLCYRHIGIVLEVVCAHFILSVSSEQAFANFTNRLFWCHGKDFKIPEISLSAALSLLREPVVLSASKMFQTYVILLVSEVIGIFTASENMMLDDQLMDWYSMAFERCIILYTRRMSSFYPESHHLAGSGSFSKSSFHSSTPLNFESFLQQAMEDKLYHLVAKSKSQNFDLVAASIAFVKDNIGIFDESYTDEILSILNCLILGCSSNDINGTLFQKGGTGSQDIYLLASILKLMSSSILQATRFLRCVGFRKSSADFSSHEEYNSILHFLGYFQQFGIYLPVQNLLYDTMQSHPARHKESKWMLLHFSGLLSLSFGSGVDFLVKGCLFTIMTVLNLFIAEEGDLNALGSLCDSRVICYLSKSSENVKGVVVVRKSTQLISSKFQKIQDAYLRTKSVVVSDKRKQRDQVETSENSSDPNGLDSAVIVANNSVRTCNGETYLKCLLGKRSKVSDFDELADFIVCEPEKDYSEWLKNKEKFRRWKYEKMLKFRWKKRKLAWNSKLR